MPALATGVRSAEPPDSRHTGALLAVQAAPTSTNGDSSSGGSGDEIRPNPSVPSTGMRSSALATARRLPMRRSSCGHELPASEPVPAVVQSPLPNDSYA